MNESFDIQHELKLFAGHAPLFPLPNVVHFPHTWLPLHIFEPRYRTLVEDALEGDRLIAMALLRPNWESSYATKFAELHPVVCLGRIAVEERLPDGRFNLALRGLCRARIESEIESSQPYRTAELTLLPDFYPSGQTIDRVHRQRELLAGAVELLPELQSELLLHQLVEADIPLGALCDVLAHSLGLKPDDAQMLLEEPDVDLRSDIVLHYLRQRLRRQTSIVAGGFPPAFSAN